MQNPPSESVDAPLRLDLDRRLWLQFRGSVVVPYHHLAHARFQDLSKPRSEVKRGRRSNAPHSPFAGGNSPVRCVWVGGVAREFAGIYQIDLRKCTDGVLSRLAV